jgi:formylmethanofuran dehydrogenase subunit E
MIIIDYINNQDQEVLDDVNICAKCKNVVSLDDATIVYGKVVCLSCSAEVYQTISTKQVGAL